MLVPGIEWGKKWVCFAFPFFLETSFLTEVILLYQINNDDDSSDDDSLDDNEAEETALESYQTPLDEDNCPVDEYIIFKQILQSRWQET